MIKPKEEIFQYYFYFIQERMNIFWNKYKNIRPWTTDEILSVHKFTNVYRAIDRVSQYYFFKKIINSNSLSEVYELLRNCSFIGNFLAYQYAIDMNYSSVIDFSENSFVKAGIGSIRGIKKCFEPLSKKYSFEDAIKYTQDNFEKYQNIFGYTDFELLFERVPTLIDLQNCFCETDKYLRAKIPELQVDNKRIKQKYKESTKPLELFFPPKWNINSIILTSCMQPSAHESTLF